MLDEKAISNKGGGVKILGGEYSDGEGLRSDWGSGGRYFVHCIAFISTV